MSSEPIISLRNISKSYWVYDHPLHRLLNRLTGGFIGRRKEFKALCDVSFDVFEGETIGLIGCNGSGKSTLLQIISGIRQPSKGLVQVKGRVSALLELGSGFQPEMTGRENIYLQAAVMGLSHEEVENHFDEIINFAEIDTDYLDQPVKNYSSGMFVRLAFAVAISYQPEILIVDEALSVGDFFFQQKCIKKIHELQKNGTSLLLVSHDRSVILSTCSRAILLAEGKVALQGRPDEVINFYQAATSSKNNSNANQPSFNPNSHATGGNKVFIAKIRLLNQENQAIEVIETGELFTFEFEVDVRQTLTKLTLGFTIRNRLGQDVFGINTQDMNQILVDLIEGERYTYRFRLRNNLGPGTFSISATLSNPDNTTGSNYESREFALIFESVNSHSHNFIGSTWLSPSLEISSHKGLATT